MRRLLGRLEQWRPWPIAALALVSYVPLLLTHRGQVGADTKSYLYLNPGKLLADAPWLWETGVGLGTVTHQNMTQSTSTSSQRCSRLSMRGWRTGAGG